MSVRAGVIRRRVRWLSRVGLVLVLALVLSVVGAIRSDQQAQAFAPALLAPAAPVLVASGPPGWVLGGALLLGSVLAAEALRSTDGDGNAWWEGAGDRWKDLLSGAKQSWDNRDGSKDPSSTDSKGDVDSTTVVMGRPFVLDNFRESDDGTTANPKRKKLVFDVTWPSVAGTLTKDWRYTSFAHLRLQCRDSAGKIVPEIRSLQLASVLAGNDLSWPRQTASVQCTGGREVVDISMLPMTKADWDSYSDGSSTKYPRADSILKIVDRSVDRGFFWRMNSLYEGTDGTKTTVTCESPDGTVELVAGSSRDADGVKIPTCPDGWDVKGLKMERTYPDGTVNPVPFSEVSKVGERPVSVAVDGQECVQGREGCANWTEVRQTNPERVQCLSNGAVIPSAHCNVLERFYENGGTTVHPDNIDGNPNTYADPWRDPAFKPVVQQPDGTYAPAPYRPVERPPVIAPQPWAPDPNWDPNNDPNDPRNDPEPTQQPTSPAQPDPEPTAPPTVPPDLDPDYDPLKDPLHPDYDPRFDPNHPDYDPKKDPSHPDYDPSSDPNFPQPDPSPSSPPAPEPSTPAEPEPSPEPSSEPSGDPDEGEEPEPGEEPTAAPEPTPSLQPGLDPVDPPYDPPPTAVGVDEWGHLLPITASLGTLSVTPSGARVYTQPETQVATTYFPDGTKQTTFTAPEVGTPTGTVPMDLKTVTAPDGTRTTTGYPSVPKIETPGTFLDTPTKGTHPPIEVTDGTCETTLCISIPEPPDAMKTKNCIRGAYSWNPVDWVKTPVLCALREAFEPSPDKLDANVQRIKIALSARGFDILIKSFEDVVTATPGGGGGCMGPPISFPLQGKEFTFWPFAACEGAMANVAHYTHIFVTFVTGIFGMIGVIRNIAYGFGHRVQVGEGTESSS